MAKPYAAIELDAAAVADSAARGLRSWQVAALVAVDLAALVVAYPDASAALVAFVGPAV